MPGEKERKIQKVLNGTEADQLTAQSIVDAVLGLGYVASYFDLPKNVGVMGDEGVRAHSVLVYSTVPRETLMPPEDQLEEIARRITGETGAASRVLYDVTVYPVGELPPNPIYDFMGGWTGQSPQD